MIITYKQRANGNGYIAGSGSGIVTSQSKACARKVLLFNAVTFKFVMQTKSLENGHYMFSGIDANEQYLMIAREIESKAKNSNIAGWDRIDPATDLTISEQQELWKSWQ